MAVFALMPHTRKCGVQLQSQSTSACAWQLQALTPRLKPNPRARKTGPPMKLYNADELQALAVAKFGTLEAVEAERDRRLAAREQRAEAKLQRARPSSTRARRTVLGNLLVV